MATINEAFGELSISITPRQILDVEKFAVRFPLRGTHPLTFDGPYLGVHPVAFTTSDYNTLFDIFNIRKQDVEKVVRNASSINRSFAVTSDPFNLLVFWICHLAHIYIKDKQTRHEFMFNLLMLYHFKTFCSVVNNSFRYGTNEGIVTATVAALSKKSDIIQQESWKRLITTHCEKILDPEGRFYKTLIDASPDEAFLRVISESQTALRAKIVTFAKAYYQAYSAGESVAFKSSISENAEGERIIAQTASVIDSATQAMVSEILNPNMFIHDISVDDIAAPISTISSRMLKTALLRINETAVLQLSSRTFDKVEVTKEGTLYIGIRGLIVEIIRSTIRMCREKRVHMGDRAQIFRTVNDAITSSRNLDQDVSNIKRSVGVLVESFNITTNTASSAALRKAVILYIVYRTIQKLKS